MEITIDLIASMFPNTKDKKQMRTIKNEVIAHLSKDRELTEEEKADIESQVERVTKEDQKLERESILKYTKGKGYNRKGKSGGVACCEPARIDSTYFGTAGEMAVISELMFRGFNANRMLIDDGVDIIAVKNNIYSYIQVKTTTVKDGRISVQIKQERHDQYIQNLLKYVIVVRTDKGNRFFVIPNDEINRGVHERYIKRGEENISIKIKFSPQSGDPFFYDEKERPASYFENRFE